MQVVISFVVVMLLTRSVDRVSLPVLSGAKIAWTLGLTPPSALSSVTKATARSTCKPYNW